MQLTSTVFHVWGKLNRTFDRSAQGENLLDYFDQYVKWTDPSKPNFLQVCGRGGGLTVADCVFVGRCMLARSVRGLGLLERKRAGCKHVLCSCCGTQTSSTQPACLHIWLC